VSARNLHENPELLQNGLADLAQRPFIILTRKKSARPTTEMDDQAMTSLATPTVDLGAAEGNALVLKLAVALGLAAFADWLFYAEDLGVSVAIFAVALTCGALVANPFSRERRRIVMACIILVGGLIPVVEELDVMSFILLVLALATSVATVTGSDLSGPRSRLVALRDLLLTGPYRLVRDVAAGFHGPSVMTGMAMWFVPLALGAIFVALFASANPLIEQWIDLFRPANPASQFSVSRLLFWLATLSIVWPFVHIRRRRKIASDATAVPPVICESQASARWDHLFGPATILRSLVLFNMLFAVQTILDMTYLWGNGTLPAGLSYAAYAHRGAYALTIATLLAACFALAAVRPGAADKEPTFLRPLVYLFVAQNIVLVASSVLRLKLYVETYLLTYWRITAFVWMLIALGLIFILARIALERSNEWLVRINLTALFAALYLCSLTNLAAIVSDYNVTHSREAGGSGVQLDACYLSSLGPQALPALDKAIQIGKFSPNLESRRDQLLERQSHDMASWRAWSFRGWRLQRDLNAHAGAG
jgi:hypothetical protein